MTYTRSVKVNTDAWHTVVVPFLDDDDGDGSPQRGSSLQNNTRRDGPVDLLVRHGTIVAVVVRRSKDRLRATVVYNSQRTPIDIYGKCREHTTCGLS